MTVCGYINATDSSGENTGRQLFIGAFTDTKFTAVGVGGEEKLQEATLQICEQKGVQLNG